MSMTTNEKMDYFKWYKETPDAGFSPERNREVIRQTIIKSELMRESRKRDYIEQIRERADAVTTYLKSVANGNEKGVDEYFGRKELARLRGQQIVEEIKGRMKRLFSLD